MGNFLQLINNENMKIYRRLRTWVMMGLVILIPALIAVLMKVSMNNEPGPWDMFSELTVMYVLVSIFSAVIFADIVASEFGWGTIKLLLIRPWKRGKILLSKLLAGILFSLLLTVLFMAVDFILSFALFHGTSSSSYPGGHSAFSYSMEMLLYRYVDLMVICIFAFMLSTLFRSSGIAIGLAMFILFARNIFQLLLDPERYSWAKYVLFTNMDLSRYMLGSGTAGMTLGFSAVVLAVYVIVFLAVSWIVFIKRDVAA
ncbi:ABC transporter permease [Paenibacillus yonginensis]|uniref:ABC transporter permease n=1 Tax=Paenibacillus yonginensis TaxID=1462996 RepID=A0A1B1MW33_9BACL|nr:ABC transporter permease [Paenibacillus yonginensis]ANS73393.1 ABC transporter permease [Paenibacillus yonginensis]